MLIRFSKSSQSWLWVNTDLIAAVQQNGEDVENCSKASISIVLGTPSDVPQFADDTFMGWAKHLDFEFETNEDCENAFKALRNCMGGMNID